MSKLVCIHGMNKGDEFPVHEGRNVLGRAESNIVLFDKKCSRQHCALYKRGNHYSVEDLESRNGTLLNCKPLIGKPKSCKFGDQIKIGKTVLVLSDKGIGGLIQQTASDVAAELQSNKFGKLMTDASSNLKRPDNHTARPCGLIGRLKALFGK